MLRLLSPRKLAAVCAVAALPALGVAACSAAGGPSSSASSASSSGTGYTCWESGSGVVLTTTSTVNASCNGSAFVIPGQPYTQIAGAPSSAAVYACTATFPTITWTVYATDDSGTSLDLCNQLLNDDGGTP